MTCWQEWTSRSPVLLYCNYFGSFFTWTHCIPAAGDGNNGGQRAAALEGRQVVFPSGR
jgi:hypothetical protein